MATSGTYTYTLNKDQIISLAFQGLNIYDPNEAIDADDYAFASAILNLMIKSWEGNGINLWKRRQATLFPILNQVSYALGNVSGADRCTNTYVSDALTAAVGSSVTSISVSNASSFTVGAYLGIELDDGTRQWTTVSTASGTTITFPTPLTDTAASTNTVVSYSSLINRPLRVLRGTRVDLKNSSAESVLQDISYDEYFNMPLKTLSGYPCNFYYDRLINNSVSYTGTLYLYPAPSLVSTLITFTYQDSLQDMINSTDNADFPQEWMYCIVINLQNELCLPYGKVAELALIAPKAEKLLTMIQNFDSDDSSLSMLPDENSR